MADVMAAAKYVEVRDLYSGVSLSRISDNETPNLVIRYPDKIYPEQMNNASFQHYVGGMYSSLLCNWILKPYSELIQHT